jgi:HEAT repeat protein
MNFKTVLPTVAIAILGLSSAVAAQKPGDLFDASPKAAGMPLAQRSGAAPGSVEPGDKRFDELYEDGREAIEEGRYERAIAQFDRLIPYKTDRTDAALYWKAYSQSKIGNRAGALETLASLQKLFADSRWIRDAKALEVEVKQASGQPVSPASQDDDELKLLALRGLMQSDPEQAFPVIEKMLSGPNSPKVKDRALFVVSQSRAPRARDLIVSVAKGGANPDLQLRAIRYIGMMGGDNRQILADVYGVTKDPAVKRSIIRSLMTAGDRERIHTLAKTESDASLRGEAVRQLGVMGGLAELSELYGTETSIEVRKSILQSMFVGGDAARLIELAKTEKEPELRRSAIRNLGVMNKPETAAALVSIYGSDASVDIRKAVVGALFVQGNGSALVTLARGEQNPELKRDIVSKLSTMKSKEATDYLLELLK